MMLVDHLPSIGKQQIIKKKKKKKKKKKDRELINTGKYNEDIAKYIPGLLELKSQGSILIPGKKLSILPTLMWKRLIFKYC